MLEEEEGPPHPSDHVAQPEGAPLPATGAASGRSGDGPAQGPGSCPCSSAVQCDWPLRSPPGIVLPWRPTSPSLALQSPREGVPAGPEGRAQLRLP